MGFLDTVNKARQFDQMQADQVAGNAHKIAAYDDAQRMQEAQYMSNMLDQARQQGQYEGLAGARQYAMTNADQGGYAMQGQPNVSMEEIKRAQELFGPNVDMRQIQAMRNQEAQYSQNPETLGAMQNSVQENPVIPPQDGGLASRVAGR